MSKEDKIIRAIYKQILDDLEYKVDTEPHNIVAAQNETTWQLADEEEKKKDETLKTEEDYSFKGKRITISYGTVSRKAVSKEFHSYITFGVENHGDADESTIYLQWWHRFTPLVIRTKKVLKKGWRAQRLNEALLIDKKYAKLNSDRIDKILLGDKKGEKEQSDK